MLYGQTVRNRKWKIKENQSIQMAASKLEIRISQLVHKIATKLQRLYQCFRSIAIQMGIVIMLYDQMVRNRN